VGELDGEVCHLAPYRSATGELVAQKVRQPGKRFHMRGDGKNAPLFGQHIFNRGKSVVVTEGELDCLAVAQAFDCKWPVVSLPNGAQSAAKSIKRAYEWLDGFDKIFLWFDNDDPGRAAVEEVAPLLPPGKVYVITGPEDTKDANDVLLKHGAAAITKAYWNASAWRPDGIVPGGEITIESLKTAMAPGFALPYPALQDKLSGLRKRELTLLTAGSGIGKSTMAREIGHHLAKNHGLRIGNVFLEESKEKTAQGYIAIDNNVPLGNLRLDPNILSEEQWAQSMPLVQSMYFYDHFGSLDSEHLLSKLRYMAQVLGCDFIILDHISIVISGQESSSEGERKDIDRLMTKLRQLVEETGVGVLGIVHLKQPEGRAHEEGGRVTLSHLRGSGSLKQLSDSVIALERDQQDVEASNVLTVRLLKNREFGDLGECDLLEYAKPTGRLQLFGGEFPDGTGPNI
jgi:twinkle protein